MPASTRWEDYEANLAQLRANRQAHGEDRRHGPPREGPALLQGLLICGRCGNRMTVGYHDVKKGKRLYPEYRCQKEYVEEGDDKCCQRLLGAGLDTVIADLLLAQLTPLAIETSIQIWAGAGMERAKEEGDCRSRRDPLCSPRAWRIFGSCLSVWMYFLTWS